MLRVTFTGNLTVDPKIGTTAKGDHMCQLNVAVRGAKYSNNFYGQGEPEPVYMEVSAFGQLGERCATYLKKGRSVAVSGSFRSIEIYKGKKNGEPKLGMRMRADEVEFGFDSQRQNAEEAPENAPKAEPGQGKGFVPTGFVEVNEEDLPF